MSSLTSISSAASAGVAVKTASIRAAETTAANFFSFIFSALRMAFWLRRYARESIALEMRIMARMTQKMIADKALISGLTFLRVIE